MSRPTQDELEKALKDAEAAHYDYELVRLMGIRDETWSGFYAAYVLGRFGGFTSASTLSQWLEEAPAGEKWGVTAASYVLSRLASQ
jgi:hypothetical protein